MKFLVIGGSGFLGRHVLAEARQGGCEAIGTTTREAAHGLLHFDLADDRPILDTVPASFFARTTPWVVICSCTTPMDRCRTDWNYAYKVNVTNTIRLIDDVRSRGARVVFVSTSYVFDGSLGYYPEDWPHSPTSAYGEQKSIVDRYVRDRCPDSIVVRLDKIIGDAPGTGHPFAEWWQLANEGKVIRCIENQIMSPTWVVDIARGIVALCRSGKTGVYHLTNPETFRRDLLARHFFRTMGVDAEVVSRPMASFGFADPRPLFTYLDSTRFVEETGLRFSTMSAVMQRFREAVARTANEQAGRSAA